MSPNNTFYAILGALWMAGGAAILLFETPFPQESGWFGVVTGSALLIALVYNMIRKR